MTTETLPTDDAPPWRPPYDPNLTVATTLHLLTANPTAQFGPMTYPSLDIQVTAEHGTYANFYVSVTGDAEQRAAFAADLHRVADLMAAWHEEQGL